MIRHLARLAWLPYELTFALAERVEERLFHIDLDAYADNFELGVERAQAEGRLLRRDEAA